MSKKTSRSAVCANRHSAVLCAKTRHFFAVCANLVSVLCAVLIFTGCSKNETAASRTQKTTASVSDVIQQRMAESDANKTANAAQVATAQTSAPLVTHSNPAPGTSPQTPATAETANSAPTPETQTTPPAPAHKAPDPIKSESVSVDVDLTALSSTMVYSEVLNIMTYPETYVGKTVKMRGIFSYYHDEKTEQYYFGCIIQDATACCARGIEFILTDDYLFPDDCPTEGEIVTVAGEFDIYEENGLDYFTLRHSKLLV